MPTDLTTDQLSGIVRQQLMDILGDPAQRQQVLGGTTFTADDRDTLENLNAQVGSILQDRSLGRVMNGPQWMSGVSMLDGTVTAAKISVNSLDAITVNSGDINVTGDITAAGTFPAVGARLVLNSTDGFAQYSDATTTVAQFGMDGKWSLGPATGSQIEYDGSQLIVPAATIANLTIADVGGGTLGGAYVTSTSTTNVTLSSAGIVAKALGTETFNLSASTGAMTATGSFTIKSASSGARVVIDNAGGIEGFNASGVSTFRFNAATGAGYVGGTGSGTNGISWNSSGTVSIGGASFSGGKITANSLSVTSLSAISTNIGTITAGTINAASVTVSNINASNVNSGSLNGALLSSGSVADSAVNSVSANKITAGTGIINNLTVKSTLTLGSGGKIVDSDGSYWDQSGITLKSSGSNGDVISWQNGGVFKGGIYATSTQFVVLGTGGGGIAFDSGVRANGRFYPGQVAAYGLSGMYIEAFELVPAVIRMSTPQLRISGSSSYPGIYFEAIQNGGSAASWSSGGPSTAYFTISIAGTTYRVPFYANS